MLKPRRPKLAVLEYDWEVDYLAAAPDCDQVERS